MGAVPRAVPDAGGPLTILAIVVLAWGFAYVVVSAVACFRALRPRAPADPSDDDFLLVRPLAGADPGLRDRLLAAPDRGRIRFAVERADDPAAGPAERAAAELRRRGRDAIRVITNATEANRKVGQIAATIAREIDPPPLVLIADADVDLAEFPVDRLLGEVRGPIAAAWAPVVEVAADTLADRASAALLGGSLHAFPVLATIDRGGLVGKLCAVRRDALEGVGGFRAFADVLGEDMALAAVLAGRTTVAPLVGCSRARGRSLRDVIDRYVRWLLVIRWQRPALLASYPLLLAAGPILLALAAAHPQGSALAAPIVAARLTVALVAAGVSGRGLAIERAVADAVLADALLLVAFVGALGARTARWRGRVIPRPAARMDGARRWSGRTPSG